MINIYLEPLQDKNKIDREHVYYFIREKLPLHLKSIRHHAGYLLEDAPDSTVTEDTKKNVNPFTFVYNPQNFIENQEFMLSIRGIGEVEDCLFERVQEGRVVKLANVSCRVIRVSYKPELRSHLAADTLFYTKSPVICRVKIDDTYDSLELGLYNIEKYGKYYYLTSEQNRVLMSKHLTKKLISKAISIYGETFVKSKGDVEVIVQAGGIRRSPAIKLNGKERISLAASYCNAVLVKGDAFWNNLAFNLGIGDFTRYGMGLMMLNDF